jgi:uncharacterized membrane protein YphA (DoxX/SURF4 family)
MDELALKRGGYLRSHGKAFGDVLAPLMIIFGLIARIGGLLFVITCCLPSSCAHWRPVHTQ